MEYSSPTSSSPALSAIMDPVAMLANVVDFDLTTTVTPSDLASPSPFPDIKLEGDDLEDGEADKKPTKKRKSWGQVLPEPKTNLPPRLVVTSPTATWSQPSLTAHIENEQRPRMKKSNAVSSVSSETARPPPPQGSESDKKPRPSPCGTRSSRPSCPCFRSATSSWSAS